MGLHGGVSHVRSGNCRLIHHCAAAMAVSRSGLKPATCSTIQSFFAFLFAQNIVEAGPSAGACLAAVRNEAAFSGNDFGG
jgi:hypothetical protein